MVEREIPGGLSVLLDGAGNAFLLPAERSTRAVTRLQSRCRALAAAVAGKSGLEGVVPGTTRIEWASLDGGGLLPLPAVPAPAGEPMDRWPGGAAATTAGLLTVLADLARAVDGLAAMGYVPEPLGLNSVWAAGDGVSWLPAPLSWRRPVGAPTGESLRAASRTVARFLQEALQQSRHLGGIEQVWEELWTLCYQGLEHGYGPNAAYLVDSLGALKGRVSGLPPDGQPRPVTWIWVDAVSIQRLLKYQTLDLAGLLRSLAGDARCRGAVVGNAGLPAYWRQAAQLCGLDWQEGDPSDFRTLGELARSSGATAHLVICGAPADVVHGLPWLRAQRGEVVALGPEQAAPLPEGWVQRHPGPGINRWCRFGWAGSHRLEVPGNVNS